MKLKFTYVTPQSLLSKVRTGQVSLPKSISNLGPGSVALLMAPLNNKKKTWQKCVS